MYIITLAITKLYGVYIILYVRTIMMSLSLSGELIVSRYVAETITTDAGRFGHVGLCQLHTKLKILQCETIAVELVSSAHDQFARYDHYVYIIIVIYIRSTYLYNSG